MSFYFKLIVEFTFVDILERHFELWKTFMKERNFQFVID